MSIYLIDPKKKWCKANLHCHSSSSDGFYSKEELKRLYRKRGYQIIAFSDHEAIFDSSPLCDGSFVAITSVEFSFVKEQRPPLFRDEKTIHLNLFAKDPHNTYHVQTDKSQITPKQIEQYKPDEIKCDGAKRIFEKENVQETIDKANKAGFLVQYNHPYWSLNTREDYIGLTGLWGIEIYNHLSNLGNEAEYDIAVYDDLLREGKILNCTANDDNHNSKGSLEDSFGGFNFVGVESLTYANVISAMEKGDIYASTGPVIKALYIDEKNSKIVVKCSKASSINLVGYNRVFRHIHGKNLTSAEFKINGDEVYFRITVKDKYGKAANTHAYYLKDYNL